MRRLRKSSENKGSQQSQQSKQMARRVSIQLKDNRSTLKQNFNNSIDIQFRDLQLQDKNNTRGFICYTEGLVREEYIHQNVMDPLLGINFNKVKVNANSLISYMDSHIIKASSVNKTSSLDEAIEKILRGQTAIFIDGFDSALLVNTEHYHSRGVEEPETEATIRGSREGFNEVIRTNTSLLRRKINNPDLVFEEFIIGENTKTKVRVGYIDGIAKEEIVEEVRKRLNSIETDVVLETGYIEQYIEDHPKSIFQTIGNSEKSDKVAAKLLEGRVAILCDGTPFVLTVPYLFIENLQVPEDYYSRTFRSSIVRLIRLLALFLTVFTPAVFVAASTFHHEMVPALLLTTMAAAEERVPFPILLEALIMIVIFELLREAGVRMPRPIGSAVSIVGALVIGESAVQAGLVGAPMVIVVALTAISGFVVTAVNNTVILIRFILLFLAGTFGFYGLLLGTLFLVGHVCSLRSFSIPYLTPLAPVVAKEWRDTFVRSPMKDLQGQPGSIVRKKF
ncbi:spore germination protein KA [Gracilibacillus orientalis]|uniref:Spore germination protein KA n=1 Tax=Gracilibacillus orientalis TaxID=334253 RepID=A0A1I4Q0F4_9BACI|nr:spore germination protein [Gracilibacillus orientalis]SFM33537.1 spore germination protein KA [Gracilibacillus orientalis]SFM49309.1 spore germination protein KA [Gracilibacillus orientalis]